MKTYSDDWKHIRADLQYSEKLELYYYDGTLFDELSANHNGIIGIGYKAKEIINGTTPVNTS